MRTGKDIDFSKVDFITWDAEEYLKDIPLINVVSNYVNLASNGKQSFKGSFYINNSKYDLNLNVKENLLLINNENINAEEFLHLFGVEESQTAKIIKDLTGIDEDDYICEVQYAGGKRELLEVKGKIVYFK